MQKFRIYNRTVGWCCFATALTVYLLTVEPTVSFWDCGEFITAADKLEVGHPPGAPMFLLLARIFALLAPGTGNVALMVNCFSALASAFTVLFLFWSITHIIRRTSVIGGAVTRSSAVVILAGGAVGALAYAFSDTFWFSAVEGEVYGCSSLFTAAVFWAMLRWEEAAGQPGANRWIILIAYLIGLSIGVHLLNLLAIPAMVLIYYFRKYDVTFKGVMFSILCSVVILAGILYGIIPWMVKIAGYFELLFVNRFGFAYNAGVLFYMLLVSSLLIFGLFYTYKHKKHAANTLLLAVATILIGYSSYAMIMIRSSAGPPMDENSPDNVFALMTYLNRDQYGDRPLLYGNYYNAPENGSPVETTPVYTQLNGRYEITYRNLKPRYDNRFNTVFPRMYSSVPDHVKEYAYWGKINGRPVETVDRNGNKTTVYKPRFVENLRFFFRYQLGHMYGRYFMWNFAGRQNDVQADGTVLHGNWISGIPPVDRVRLGPQDQLPPRMKNDRGRNAYFLLPLILGFIGLLWQIQYDVKYFWVVMTLFFMTGIAIAVYLNQTPLQPRERDYAYAGSFYAFAIWIGVGVAAIYGLLLRKIPEKAAMCAACLFSVSVPAIMAQQNYDDHDRSGRYIARDIACNYLNSCAPNAILFTVGDNDTFPLWYLQEVEGVRPDIRIVNLMLLKADWYISQMKRAAYNSAPLPVDLPEEKYRTGNRDIIYLINQSNDTTIVPLRDALAFIDSDDPRTKIKTEDGEPLAYFMSKNFSIPVDKQKALDNGTVKPADAGSIEDELTFTVHPNFLFKEQWMVLEIIAANNWERPIYWTASNHSGTLGLDNYLQLDGTAFRLVPIKTSGESVANTGRIDSDILYERFMHAFRWGNINQPGVRIDHQSMQTLSIVRARNLYARLAMQLLSENQPKKAVDVLDRCMELFPASAVPHDYHSLFVAEALYQANETEKANKLLTEYANECIDQLLYFYSLPQIHLEPAERHVLLNEALLEEIVRIADAYGQSQIGINMEKRIEQAE